MIDCKILPTATHAPLAQLQLERSDDPSRYIPKGLILKCNVQIVVLSSFTFSKHYLYAYMYFSAEKKTIPSPKSLNNNGLFHIILENIQCSITSYTFFPEMDRSNPPLPLPDEVFEEALVPEMDRSRPPPLLLLPRLGPDEPLIPAVVVLVVDLAFLCATMLSLNSKKSPNEHSKSNISPLNSSAYKIR